LTSGNGCRIFVLLNDLTLKQITTMTEEILKAKVEAYLECIEELDDIAFYMSTSNDCECESHSESYYNVLSSIDLFRNKIRGLQAELDKLQK
jgi:hypothetical protein